MTDITISQLIHEELSSALIKYPLFHSEHEAYAIIKEEIEEAESDLKDIKSDLEMIWFDTRANYNPSSFYKDIRKYAVNLIKESAQIAAMCDKHEKSEKLIKEGGIDECTEC